MSKQPSQLPPRDREFYNWLCEKVNIRYANQVLDHLAGVKPQPPHYRKYRNRFEATELGGDDHE